MSLLRLLNSFAICAFSLVTPVAAADLTLISYRYSDASPVVHLRLSGEIRPDDDERLIARFNELARCTASCQNDYGGTRATDGFVVLGAISQMLLPQDLLLNELSASVRDDIRQARARDAAPVLPRHSQSWPVERVSETPWSRSYEGAGLRIVEQSGPAHLFDDLALWAEDTEIMYGKDATN